MTKAIGIGFNPSLGIERVITAHEGPGISVLPVSTSVIPSEAVASMASLQSLYASAWDRSMQNALQPHIRARELLIPGVLAERIRHAREQLAKLAKNKDSAILRQAAELLDEDNELREVLTMYRSLLIAG